MSFASNLAGGSAKRRLTNPHIIRQTIISGLILLLVLVFLMTKASSFRDSIRILMQTPADILLLAFGLQAATYGAAAVSYVALAAVASVRLKATIVVGLATGLTNRLLPAGFGNAGLYVIYLKRSGFRFSQATAIVTANNLLGAIGNFILLVAALLTAPELREPIKLPSLPVWYIIGGVLALAVVTGIIAFRGSWRAKAQKFLRDMLKSLRAALKPSRRTAISLSSNMTLTALNGLILALSVSAAGGQMYWPLAIAVLSMGAVLGAAVPTPGGLGGVEAGIFAGLVACGVPAASALAATIIYRGLTYWLPIIPGLIVLPWVRKHYLY
jgi:uncharacterized protein (TIRG00374 family)